MLKVKSLHTYYGGIHALKSVSLDLAQGEIVTLIGANGAGKSTTLMSVCGVVPGRYGEIHFMGQPIHNMSPDKIFALGVVQVPEGRRIFSSMTVTENLDMGAYLRKDKAGIPGAVNVAFAYHDVGAASAAILQPEIIKIDCSVLFKPVSKDTNVRNLRHIHLTPFRC